MPEELQHLLQRIRTEAVEKSEQEANEILAQSKRKAAAIVREAEEEAKRRLSEADHQATAYMEKSTRALEQAARDLLITIGDKVQGVLDAVVTSAVKEEMDTDFLHGLLDRTVAGYLEHGTAADGIEAWLSPADKDDLKRYFMDKYQQTVAGGLTIHTDEDMTKGFRVSIEGSRAFHDFSAEAIAESLTRFLRPQLADMIRRAARDPSAQENHTDP